jgi:hypothetical protein
MKERIHKRRRRNAAETKGPARGPFAAEPNAVVRT